MEGSYSPQAATYVASLYPIEYGHASCCDHYPPLLFFGIVVTIKEDIKTMRTTKQLHG